MCINNLEKIIQNTEYKKYRIVNSELNTSALKTIFVKPLFTNSTLQPIGCVGLAISISTRNAKILIDDLLNHLLTF